MNTTSQTPGTTPTPPSGPLSGQLTVIELFVTNAQKLFEAPGEVDKWCKLKDNFGNNSQKPGGSNDPKGFGSGVFDKSLVLWLGGLSTADANTGFTLKLEAVKLDLDQASKLLQGNLFTACGNAILAPTKEEIPKNDSEKYSLYFWLTHPNGESKQIIVDPILKSNTKTTYSLILNYLQNFDFGNLEGVKTLRDGLLNIIKS